MSATPPSYSWSTTRQDPSHDRHAAARRPERQEARELESKRGQERSKKVDGSGVTPANAKQRQAIRRGRNAPAHLYHYRAQVAPVVLLAAHTINSITK